MSTQQKIPPLSEVETRELDKQLQLMGGIVNTHELDCRCKDCGVYVDMVDELARRNKKHVGACTTLQVKKGNVANAFQS